MAIMAEPTWKVLGGGAIRNDGTLIIDNTIIDNNDADGRGGGIRNTGILSIQNSEVKNNKSSFCGAGVFSTVGTVTISGSNLTNNKYKIDYSSDLVGNIPAANITSSTVSAMFKDCSQSVIIVIDGYARNNDASNLTAGDLANAVGEETDQGTGGPLSNSIVNTANLDKYKAAIANSGCLVRNSSGVCVDVSDLKNGNVSTNDLDNARTALIGLVNEVNAIEKIKGYANNSDASALTINELSQAGVTGLVDANLSLYKTAIASKGADDVDTTSKLQAIIDAVNSTKSADVINTITGYADSVMLLH
jgi:hypothetical protein